MRLYFYLLIIYGFLFVHHKGFGQCLASKSDYEHYFTDNYLELDEIEGIWSVNLYSTLFTDYRNYSNSGIQIREVAIIAKKGVFHICPANSKFSFSDEETFVRTAAPGIYLHSRYFNDVLVEVKSNAQLSDGVLRYKFEVPAASLELKFGANYSGQTAYVECNFVKLFPSAEQIYGIQQSSNAKPKSWTGTCFAIGENLLVTNHHVVNGASNLMIRGLNGLNSKSYPIEVIAADSKTDLALIRISDPTFVGFSSIPYRINPKLNDVGTSVFTLGYPMISSMGEEVKLTNGIISSRTGFGGDLTSYQISVRSILETVAVPFFLKMAI